MAPAPAHRPESIARARELYAQGARVRDICAATGLSVGTLYHHLDGHSLPGLVPPKLPRRRIVEGQALAPLPARGRRRLAARLWRVAERQARKIEFALASRFRQSPEERAQDLAALTALAKILRDLARFEDDGFAARPARRRRGAAGESSAGVEHEAALAVEGRALYVTRTRRR